MQDKQRATKRHVVWIAIAVILVVIAAAAILLSRHRLPRWKRTYLKGSLQLQNRNPKEAIKSFRRAIEMHPDSLDAQTGIIQAYSDLDEFEKAFEEIDTAVRMGLNDSKAARLRATVHHAAATHRMSAPAATVTARFYDEVIREHIAPAIEELARHAESAEQPAMAYTLLGHMYKQLSNALLRKLRLLANERDVASGLEEPERASAIAREMTQTEAQARSAQLAMLGAYRKAIDKNPDALDARIAVAEHLITLTPPQLKAAREQLKPLLQTAANNMRVLSLMERIERLDGNNEAALGYIRSLRKLAPENAVLEVTELAILMECELWDEAGPLAENLASRHPNDPEIAYLRARWLLHQQKHAEAEKALQNAVLQEREHLAPRDQFWRPQACKLFADVLVTNSEPDKAINAYQQAIRTVKKFYRSDVPMSQISDELRNLLYDCYRALAKEMSSQDPESAADYAVSAFRVFPDRAEAYEGVSEALTQTSQTDRIVDLARTHVEAVVQTQGYESGIATCRKQIETLDNPAPLRMLEASLLTRKGSYREALEALRSLRNDFPDDLKYAQALALVHLSLNQIVEARKLYEELYETNSNNPEILRTLLRLQVQTGQMDKARSLLAGADNTLGTDETRNALLDLALSEGRAQEALRLAKDYVVSDPKNAVSHSILAELLWQTGQLDEARVSFGKALDLDPDHLPAYRRGLMDMQQGEFQTAVDFFRTAAERFPQMSVSLTVALASNGQPAEAAEILKSLGLADLSPNVRLDIPRWIFTLLLVTQDQTDAAMVQNARIISGNMGYVKDRQALLGRLAQLPPDVRQDAATTMSRFCLFAENRCPAAARAEIKHLIELMPDEPLPLCWQAAALARDGDYEEAIARFKNVISSNPSLMIARIMLADTYAQESKYDLAVTTLQDTLPLADEENVPLLRLKLGQLQESLSLWDDAIDSYKAAMSHPAIQAEACNQVALLLATSKGNPSEALPYAERAFRLMPNNAAIEDTLGWVLLLNGDTEKAITHLERAKILLPQHPSVRFHLAKAYLKAEKSAEAKVELEEALAISSSFPEAKEAAQLLSEL